MFTCPSDEQTQTHTCPTDKITCLGQVDTLFFRTQYNHPKYAYCKRLFIVSCYLLSGSLETQKFSLAFCSLQHPFLGIRVAACAHISQFISYRAVYELIPMACFSYPGPSLFGKFSLSLRFFHLSFPYCFAFSHL